MRKNNVSIALLAIVAACGAMNAAVAQSPTLPAAPMATPVMNANMPARAATLTPSVKAIPTPSNDRFAVKGHIQHNQFVKSDTFSDAQDASITAKLKKGGSQIQPMPLNVNVPSVQLAPSMGVFNPQRQSLNTGR